MVYTILNLGGICYEPASAGIYGWYIPIEHIYPDYSLPATAGIYGQYIPCKFRWGLFKKPAIAGIYGYLYRRI